MAILNSFLEETTQSAAAAAAVAAVELNFSRLLQQQQQQDDYDYEYEYEYDYDDEQYTNTNQFSQSQQITLVCAQRICGFVSFVSGVYIFWNSWKRRDHVYHRLNLGLSMHTLLWGIYHMWGNAAVPIGTPDTYGARGSTTTCTIQGFLFQITMVVPFYYVFLSCYSWAVIMHGNFDPAKYQWIEKYIHVGVHIFPIASAIYLLQIEAFNSTGLHCWIASIPFGCGDDSGIECTRGPQNINTIIWIFAGYPAIFFVLFPTAVMVALGLKVHRRQKQGIVPCGISSLAVTKQSAVYLGALYWVYLPQFIYYGMSNGGKIKSYSMALCVSTISVSLGLWFAIVYWYFSRCSSSPTGASGGRVAAGNRNNNPKLRERLSERLSRMSSSFSTSNFRMSMVSVAGSSNSADNTNDANDANAKNANANKGIQQDAAAAAAVASAAFSISRSEQDPEASIPSSETIKGSDNGNTYNNNTNNNNDDRRTSFNIFDGTAPSSNFSEFVFDGDSDDEENDFAESQHWAGCQNA